MREIAEGAIKGRFESSMDVNLIFCCMRGADRRLNLETVEAAAAFRECGVCGVDLAGAEALYPTENYKDVFELAMRENLNITIHAGEAAGADSIRAALDFGAKRIGHAVAARRDKALQKRRKAGWAPPTAATAQR